MSGECVSCRPSCFLIPNFSGFVIGVGGRETAAVILKYKRICISIDVNISKNNTMI